MEKSGTSRRIEQNLCERDPAVQEADGVIERVDVTSRELTVRIGSTPCLFALAPDCQLVLHGEPVKMRLLQALDRAHLRYAEAGDELVAYQVQVH